MDSNQIWQTALGELQLQLTSAAFDTWLQRTRLIAFENDVFTVGVHTGYAQDWLENRLHGMIKRTLAGICGRPIEVKFVVLAREVEEEAEAPSAEIAQQPEPGRPPEFVRPDINWDAAGYFPVSGYERKFWAPLLRWVAWGVWEIVRETDHRKVDAKKANPWTPDRRWSAPSLAEQVPCSRHAITGVSRADGHQPGALDRLSGLGLARVVKQSKFERDPHTMYVISVCVRMPLLTPLQVRDLPERLQLMHDVWLNDHGLDPRDWFLAI